MSWRRFQSLVRGTPFDLREQEYLRGLSQLRSRGKAFIASVIEPLWVDAGLDPESLEDAPGGFVFVSAFPRTCGFALRFTEALVLDSSTPRASDEAVCRAGALHTASWALFDLAARGDPALRDRLAELYAPEPLEALIRGEGAAPTPDPREPLLVAQHAVMASAVADCRDLAGGVEVLAARKGWRSSLEEIIRAHLALATFPAGASSRELAKVRGRPFRHLALIADLASPAPAGEAQTRLRLAQQMGELVRRTDDLFDFFSDLDRRRPNTYRSELTVPPSRLSEEGRARWPGWALELISRYRALEMALRGRPGRKELLQAAAIYLHSEAAGLK